ncbi:MAG TPA: FliG C-terminal domain-containing protein [Sedimentisphaerales bacterium]|nr:FliG C-terminal domain-containing protein [Sedimentisphaerales bacterium]
MGRQKAAMLLMSLDAATATELLKGLAPEEIQEIATELAQIDASGQRDTKEQVRVVREFCNCLKTTESQGFNIKGFINEMLISLVGKDKAEQIQAQIRKVTAKKDPFIAIRSANTDELVLALEGEHPQTIAVVLSELPAKKSQEVLALLSEDVRLRTVCRLASQEPLGTGVRERMALMVSSRLETFKGETLQVRPEKREQALRKLAIVLSGLERELRDRLLDEIKKLDEETSSTIRKLMVTWEDILSIGDRSLQEALRAVEASKLAVALYGADEEIIQKIRSNISERLAAMLDEEASLMQEPLEKEILEAREEVVKPLREANEENKLRFVQR